MKSTKALKMACLSVGLATAWSPLGGQVAHADTVIDVNLNIGATPGDPTTYNSAAIGVVFDNGSYEIHDLGSFTADNSPASYDGFFSTTGDFDHITGFVTAGFDEIGNVMVSIGSLDFGVFPPPPLEWTTFFSIDYDTAAMNLDTFLEKTLHNTFIPPTDSHASVVMNNVLRNPSPEEGEVGYAQLFAFKDASTLGVAEGNVGIHAVTVPLPNACLMGGGLFALMALGKRSVKWIHLRQPQSLA